MKKSEIALTIFLSFVAGWILGIVQEAIAYGKF